MTKAEKLTAFQMRMEGISWDDIGEALGYCGTTVYQDIQNSLRRPKILNVRFPLIKNYIERECGGSLKLFAKMCGLSENTLYGCFSRKLHRDPSKETIDAILKQTGMSYQEAFMEEEQKD